jgi:hypothetical protein
MCVHQFEGLPNWYKSYAYVILIRESVNSNYGAHYSTYIEYWNSRRVGEEMGGLILPAIKGQSWIGDFHYFC